jgi:hypothetical protein
MFAGTPNSDSSDGGNAEENAAATPAQTAHQDPGHFESALTLPQAGRFASSYHLAPGN